MFPEPFVVNIVLSFHVELVDIHLGNRFGGTPLVIAMETGQIEVMRYLISKGVDVNRAPTHG